MENYNTIVIIVSILVPMIAGFGWILHRFTKIDDRLVNIESRLTVVETVLAMMGMPIKPNKKQIGQDV